jgi:hypothetical protein
LADLDVLGAADAHHRKVPGVDLEQGDIAFGIGADHLGDEFAPVGELHVNDLGTVDHVRVGENVTLRAHDESRADPVHGRLLGHRQLEAAEELVHGIVLVERQVLVRRGARLLRHADVDHRRARLLGELAEVGTRRAGERL